MHETEQFLVALATFHEQAALWGRALYNAGEGATVSNRGCTGCGARGLRDGLAVLLLAAGATGCLPTMQSGAFTVHRSSTEEALTQVRSRAELELKCAKDQIDWVGLGVRFDLYNNNYPNQIGATGCGHKAVYFETNAGWLMNTETSR